MSHNTDLYRAMIESSNDQEATSQPHDPIDEAKDENALIHVDPDALIIAQQNDIRAEASAVPYVGDLVPILELKAGMGRMAAWGCMGAWIET